MMFFTVPMLNSEMQNPGSLREKLRLCLPSSKAATRRGCFVLTHSLCPLFESRRRGQQRDNYICIAVTLLNSKFLTKKYIPELFSQQYR